MDDAYLGEIRIFPYTFTPTDWMPCNGQSLPVSQYSALYAVIGAQFGGTASATAFNLPNLNGQAVMGTSPTYVTGEQVGAAQVTLDQTTMPFHTHGMQRKGATNALTGKVNTPGTQTNIGGTTAVISGTTTQAIPTFLNGVAPNTTLAPNALGVTGGGTPHDNMQPYLKMQYYICVNGAFPTHS